MNESIEIEGLTELIAEFESAGSKVNLAMAGWLRRIANHGVKQAQIEILNVQAVDTNELIQGIHAEYSDNGLEATILPSSLADKYAAAVEEGTRPHWPPISALEGWAERHGIPAFLVARKIAQVGTEPRHFWQATYEDLGAYADTELDSLGDSILGAL